MKTTKMTGRSLLRRLERLETRLTPDILTVVAHVEFVSPEGRVTSSLVLESGKPPTKIPPSGPAASGATR